MAKWLSDTSFWSLKRVSKYFCACYKGWIRVVLYISLKLSQLIYHLVGLIRTLWYLEGCFVQIEAGELDLLNHFLIKRMFFLQMEICKWVNNWAQTLFKIQVYERVNICQRCSLKRCRQKTSLVSVDWLSRYSVSVRISEKGRSLFDKEMHSRDFVLVRITWWLGAFTGTSNKSFSNSFSHRFLTPAHHAN